MLRPAPRSASIGSVRVANHAGAAPNTMPVRSARPDANASTIGDGSRVDRQERRARKRQRKQQACGAHSDDEPGDRPGDREEDAFDERLVTICRRDAPMASRIAVCPRRATARASNRFATLAQAMRSTSAQTPRRICRLRPYCSFMTPTPAPAGTTVIAWLGSVRRTSGIQFDG